MIKLSNVASGILAESAKHTFDLNELLGRSVEDLLRAGLSYREQHDAEFTSYVEYTYNHERKPAWAVVYKDHHVGFYRTREEARMKIRSLKPFRSYQPLTAEESVKLDISRRPWNRFTRVLRDLYDLDPVYDPA